MGALWGQSVDTLSLSFAPLFPDQNIIAQWVQLTLSIAEGSQWSAPEYGLDLRAFVLRGLTPSALATLPTLVERALTDAPFSRIASASATLTPAFSAGGGAILRMTILVTPKGAASAPFILTGTASADLVQIELRGLA